MITLFKNFSDTKTPKLVEIDYVLDSIRDCKIQKQLDKIQAEPDEKKKRELKKQLPCILFSGEFTERLDKAMVKHSGFVVLDWDKLTDLEAKKKEICSHPFIYACFVSPSGNGLKAIAKIPPIINKHRGYYIGLNRLFSDLDATSINESRICYMSCDSSLYVNKNAIEFLDYVDVKELQKMPENILNQKSTGTSKIDIALNMIKQSVDGQKHIELLKASRLMGGYISGGLVGENMAIQLLEAEIYNRGCDDMQAAKVAIKKGIEHGKVSPIQIETKQEYVSKTQSIINVEDENFEFLAKEKEINEYLQQWIDGTFKRGLSTGMPTLDKHFVFKRGNFNVVNGFDNVGKSTALWYLCLLSAMFNGWRWILYSNENRNGNVVKKLLEFYWGEPINRLSDTQIKKGRKFISEHFTLISNEFLFNYKDILNITEKLSKKKKYDGLLIDPYNSLKIELSNNSKLSTHEYHYECASEMQVFTKKNDICIYLNCHVITGAMRLQKGETVHKAPGKADTEGGGKFSNKADDFMTFHRDVQSPDNYTKMEIHVRKIKETETGGSYTARENPYILEMQKGGCSYADIYGYNPIAEYWRNEGKQTTFVIKENVNFLDEKIVNSYQGDVPF